MNKRRFVCAVLSLLLMRLVAHVQTYSFGRADFQVGADPFSVATGDFNGDGPPADIPRQLLQIPGT